MTLENAEISAVPVDSDTSILTRLDSFHRVRANGVFRESTPLELLVHKLPDGVEYSLLIGKPIRSDDLRDILQASSDLPYQKDIAVAHLGDSDEDEFGGGVKSNLRILGSLLEVTDDSDFVNSLPGRLKTHEQAWMDLVSKRGFAARLSEQMTAKAINPALLETAKRIVDIMRQHPELWTERERSEGQSKNETLIERFGKLTPQQRGSIMDEEMKRFDDQVAEQKRRIDETDGIRFETEHEGSKWYFTGREGEVEKGEGDFITVKSGEKMAVIEQNKSGFSIYPRSGFLLPTLTWKKDEMGKRKLVVPSQFVKQEMEISTNNENIVFRYKIDPRQLANPVVGLISLYYILDMPKSNDVAPEQMPEHAVMKKSEILQSNFIKTLESLTA